MKTILRHSSGRGLALLAVSLLLLALPARAQINYQGRLTDSTGANLVDGSYSLQFSLWNAVTAGGQLWGPYLTDGGTTTGHGALANVVNGQFNVVIGGTDTAGRALTSALASAGTKYLEIKVGSAAAISPRQAILASPRALAADVLPNVTPVGNSVGIGTTTPAAGTALDVNGIGQFSGAVKVGQNANFGLHGDTSNLGLRATTGGKISFTGVNGGGNSMVWDPTQGRLDVNGRVSLTGVHWVFNSEDGVINWTGGLFFRTLSSKGDITTFTDRMMIDANGNVGIGINTPTQGKLVVNGGAGPDFATGHFLSTTGVGDSFPPFLPSEKTSIFASDAIHAAVFRAVSDARIKVIRGVSDAAADLQSLRSIQITDFTFKDVVAKGNRPQKKVIAQQVEQIYPQAISRSTDVVPDIYQKATLKDGWVQLATDLKAGERVRLLGEKAEGIHEVLEVRPGAFRTAFQPATEKVFVYGREVNDFRSVDYEAIAMLNVSATQELARKLTAMEQQNAALEQRLAEQSAAATALLTRLGKLEQALTSLENRPTATEAKLEIQGKPARYVSLKRP